MLGEQSWPSTLAVVSQKVLKITADLTISLALDMKASPVVLILSAEALLELTLGLFLARQARMLAIRCKRALTSGEHGRPRKHPGPLLVAAWGSGTEIWESKKKLGVTIRNNSKVG